MFKLNIFGNKKPSGQIELQRIVPEIKTKDSLFAEAVKATAVTDLRNQIKYELDCLVWGKDTIDQTKEAARISNTETSLRQSEIFKNLTTQFPKAMYNNYGFQVPNENSGLAKALAKQWVEENY